MHIVNISILKKDGWTLLSVDIKLDTTVLLTASSRHGHSHIYLTTYRHEGGVNYQVMAMKFYHPSHVRHVGLRRSLL